jgi:hypothetical protein
MSRAKTIMWLTDEDLEMVGVEPDSVSDEVFDELVDYMGEYFDGGFSDALYSALEHYSIETKSAKERP